MGGNYVKYTLKSEQFYPKTVFPCHFEVNHMPILYQFDVKMPLRETFLTPRYDQTNPIRRQNMKILLSSCCLSISCHSTMYQQCFPNTDFNIHKHFNNLWVDQSHICQVDKTGVSGEWLDKARQWSHSIEFDKNNSERPVDALAVKNIPHPLTDNLQSRDASASKKRTNHHSPQPATSKSPNGDGTLY